MEIGYVKQTHAEAKTAIAARLGVKGDFIRVPQLAKALGISSTSIHAQMRRGNFPVPYRKVGNVVLVKLDDYVQWFEDGEKDIIECEMLFDTAKHVPQGEELLNELESPRFKQLSTRETKAEVKARVHQEVLADMRSKGFNV